MSGRHHDEDTIGLLYAAVTDDRLSWLDDLLIAAGLRYRCLCAAMAPAEQACPACGATDDDFFAIYRCSPQASYSLAGNVGGPQITIGIAANGGGTVVGDAYANNYWIYAVHIDGTMWRSGVDLRSGGIAQSHLQMAVTLAQWLADQPSTPASWRARFRTWAQHPDMEPAYG